jgi:2,3,4,5-tetrahydropyridine-2-carboxylate N-succinyltransferase
MSLQEALLNKTASASQIESVIADLDSGIVRIAEPSENGWMVNNWAKQAVLSYFGLHDNKMSHFGDLTFRDKIPVKKTFGNVRIVPGGNSVRYGSYLADKVIMMPPAYVNIGAYVDEGTMIDSNVLVGSCAQIGKHVHLSAGVQIGGVLEPIQAQPVIIEDNAFVGAGSVVVEGVRVKQGAVIAPGVILSASTPIIEIDSDGNEVNRFSGVVPANAIIIPGVRAKGTAGFGYQTPILIGYKSESTAAKVALSEFLRDF